MFWQTPVCQGERGRKGSTHARKMNKCWKWKNEIVVYVITGDTLLDYLDLKEEL